MNRLCCHSQIALFVSFSIYVCCSPSVWSPESTQPTRYFDAALKVENWLASVERVDDDGLGTGPQGQSHFSGQWLLAKCELESEDSRGLDPAIHVDPIQRPQSRSWLTGEVGILPDALTRKSGCKRFITDWAFLSGEIARLLNSRGSDW